MRCALLLAALAVVAPAQVIDVPPQAWEDRLPQSGAFNGFFTWAGPLRCEQPGEALVGLRLRRGTVLDEVRIACAKVTCAGSDCRWSNYYTAGTAGDAGGNAGDWTLCGAGEIVSGFRAAVRNLGLNYVSDVEVECARIVSSAVRAGRVFPVSPQNRRSVHSGGPLAPALGGKLDPARSCGKYGATGIGVAVGKYPAVGLNRANVVQTFGMFCGKPDRESGCPQGSSEFPELGGVHGSNPCQPCVALRSSADPLLGPLDREIANLPVGRYNCHYYTLSFMNRTATSGPKKVPKLFDREQVLGVEVESSGECLNDEDFTAYGYRKVMSATVNPARLRVGDIVAVYATAVIATGCRHAHTGIVIQTGPTVVIRQKPDPALCVTDLTWPEFQTVYGLRGANRANVWSRDPLPR